MKRYQDYKIQFKFLFLVLILATPLLFTNAQSAKEIQDKIRQKNEEIEKLEGEIKKYQNELNTIGQEKSSLAGSIHELDLTRKKLNADISVTENKIEKTNYTIESLSKDIGNKESSITNNKEAIAVGIRAVNEYEHSSMFEVMLSENDFVAAWNDLDNALTVREAVIDNINELREVKNDLEDTKDETTTARNELVALKSKLSDQKKIVDQNTTEKNKLLAQTKNTEAGYQQLLANQTALKNTLESEVANYESQLKFILNPSSTPTGRLLSWPVDSVLVTSPFGPRWGRMHAGTDFRAAVGTPVKSVADGRVLGAGNTDLTCPKASFGQWILIKHDNGLSTVYAHLSLIKVEKGDRVRRGEEIAYSGSSGSSTGPHLHLGVYLSEDSEGNPGVQVLTIPSKSCNGKTLTQPIAPTNSYVDPMKYLPAL